MSNQLTKGIEMDKYKREEFEKLSRPLMKWLCDNVSPHHTINITPTNAELLQGCCSTGQVLDYVKD